MVDSKTVACLFVSPLNGADVLQLSISINVNHLHFIDERYTNKEAHIRKIDALAVALNEVPFGLLVALGAAVVVEFVFAGQVATAVDNKANF